MSEDADPTFADWMIHMIPFLFISGILIIGFVAAIYWIASAAYTVPNGVRDSVLQQKIAGCFAAKDAQTLRQLRMIDMERFTTQRATACLSPGAYRLTIGNDIIKTSWDDTKASAKAFTLNVRVSRKGLVSSDKLLIEVQQ